jgi:diguanylate cyclase (GGDEF)-like protein/PAS domain S-box-containing protein
MTKRSLKSLTKEELIAQISRLKESEEKYKLVLDYSSDPIFAFADDGTYLYVNQAFADGVNKSLGEIQGKKIWDVFPSEEADKRYAVVKWVFENAQVKVIEVRVPRDDGDRFYITTVKPVIDHQGKVTNVICISKEITERKTLEEALLSLSTRDLLTGLYNRNFFEVEMDRLQVSRMFPVSIVVADMDNLKGINDRYGHAKGDEVLRQMAGCFKQAFRAEDIISRIGGDEFGVLLPFTEHSPAMEAVDRLKAIMNSQQNEFLRISIGLASSGLEGELQEVMKRADDLMYREKMSHRISHR